MEKVVEKIHVEEGMLIINQHYMALQTPDGVTLPADLDEYGQYQPILELMRLISCDADMPGNITGETQVVLQQAFLGQHSLLSHPLGCSMDETYRNSSILQAIHPQTEKDYVRASIEKESNKIALDLLTGHRGRTASTRFPKSSRRVKKLSKSLYHRKISDRKWDPIRSSASNI